MIYYLISIALFTLIFWGLHKARLVSVCPICAGVVITWVGGIIALSLETSWANPLMIGILIGASIGALVTKYGSTLGLLWKSLVTVLGVASVYLLLQKQFWLGLALIAVIVILTIIYRPKKNTSTEVKKDLFENCC